MGTLQTLISNISDWQTLSPDEILATLSARTILFRDDGNWTWKGIAAVIDQDTGHRFGREGCKRLQDALKAAGEELWVSQISAGMPLTDPEIQGVLRYLDQVGAVPGARHIADAVLRNVSPLEQANITTTPEEVAQVQASMKLDLYKQAKIDVKQDQLNCYRVAMDLWDGTGPEPEF